MKIFSMETIEKNFVVKKTKKINTSRISRQTFNILLSCI